MIYYIVYYIYIIYYWSFKRIAVLDCVRKLPRGVLNLFVPGNFRTRVHSETRDMIFYLENTNFLEWNLWTATKWPPKHRIWTRTGAKCTARCGDSEYEGPGVDFGKLIFGISGNFEWRLGKICINFGMIFK